MENRLTRRGFISFFLLGGFISLFRKKAAAEPKEKKALFWRRKDEA